MSDSGLDRRAFLGHAALALTACSAGNSLPVNEGLLASPPLLLPPALQRGMRVGLITPASQLAGKDAHSVAEERVRALGYEPVLSAHAKAQRGYLAGTDEERLTDLHAFFADKSIDAIWCLRGGYGTLRILASVDYALIKRNPKALIGYSDITALHLAIQKLTGLVTFHGPMPGQVLSAYSAAELQRVLTARSGSLSIGAEPPAVATAPDDKREAPPVLATIRGGQAEGPLTGGNLTLVCRLMGTPFEPDLAGRILYLEDVGEAPYRIDGMLSQLKLSGKLKSCAGILLGRFTGARGDDPSPTDLKDLFHDLLSGLALPVCYGFPCGHVSDQTTLPNGVRARLDADKGSLRLLAPCVR